jgi:hypothetical protein
LQKSDFCVGLRGGRFDRENNSESGLALLGIMVRVGTNNEMQAFVEEHWAFLVATLNDPVVR